MTEHIGQRLSEWFGMPDALSFVRAGVLVGALLVAIGVLYPLASLLADKMRR